MMSSTLLKGQVGTNTEAPKFTLNIRKRPDISLTDGLLVPKMKLTDLNKRSNSYSTDQDGAIVYITDISGSTIAQTEDINSVFFVLLQCYFFNVDFAE